MFEIRDEDRYWESVRERIESPLPDKEEVVIPLAEIEEIEKAIGMIQSACHKIGNCKYCDLWSEKEGCAIKAKEWDV